MTFKLLLAAILSLPTFAEDREHPLKQEQLEILSTGIAAASSHRPKPPADWAALVATIGYHETGFSLRVQAGDCKPHECDGGRARGPWQMHKNRHTEPVWDQLVGLEFTALQARVASDMLERSYWQCARSGVPWLQGTINAYAGRRCSAEWPGLQQRIATFERLRRKL